MTRLFVFAQHGAQPRNRTPLRALRRDAVPRTKGVVDGTPGGDRTRSSGLRGQHPYLLDLRGMVGCQGIEPCVSCSRSRRAAIAHTTDDRWSRRLDLNQRSDVSQTSEDSRLLHATMERAAGVEPACSGLQPDCFRVRPCERWWFPSESNGDLPGFNRTLRPPKLENHGAPAGSRTQ